MSIASTAPRSLVTEVGALRLTLVMEWRGDRFGHCVTASLHGGAEVVLAESWEDAAESSWPCSPPVQQVDRCILGNGRDGLVAIGLAGVGHWSLAVEADERGLCWDVACRSSRPSEFLGSTYRMADPGGWRETEQGLWRPLPGAASDAGVLWQAADRDRVTWDAHSGRLVIPGNSLGKDLPATSRWKYRCAPLAGSPA